MTEPKKRVFVAINLPSDAKQELIQYISKIKKINSSHNFKYVKPEGLHLTLHFLGYLTDNQINQVKGIMADVMRGKTFFILKTDQLDGFPNLNRARVIFIDCTGDTDKALSIQKELGQTLQDLNFEIDTRPWRSHLTLCRVKNNEKFKIPDFDPPKIEFKVNSIDLMKSKLTPRGAEYSILETFALK